MGLHPLVRTLWVLTLVTAQAVAQEDGVLEVPAPETTTIVIDPGKLTTLKYIFVIIRFKIGYVLSKEMSVVF